jgi:hypothetical protein
MLPDVLPLKLKLEILKEAAVAPLPDTLTLKALLDVWVMVGFEPITLMFLLVHDTALVHEQEPAGTYTPSPPKMVELAYPVVPAEESVIAFCTSL